MTVLRVAAVQASYVLMDRDATIGRVAELTAAAAREGAQLVVFPEVFVPGTPVWIDTQPIWDGDEDWFALLAQNAVVDAGQARIGGLICWENYMPLARFHLYAQGVDLWIAPTLAVGDGWIATMRHLARENRMFVVAVNPVLHADQVPAGFPARDRLLAPGHLEENGPWLEEGNTVIVAPDGTVLAGPAREREETLVLGLDLRTVAAARRFLDPVGHYNRPDIFRLYVDTSPRPAVTELNS